MPLPFNFSSKVPLVAVKEESKGDEVPKFAVPGDINLHTDEEDDETTEDMQPEYDLKEMEEGDKTMEPKPEEEAKTEEDGNSEEDDKSEEEAKSPEAPSKPSSGSGTLAEELAKWGRTFFFGGGGGMYFGVRSWSFDVALNSSMCRRLDKNFCLMERVLDLQVSDTKKKKKQRLH